METNATSKQQSSTGKVGHMALWTLQIVLAVAFLFSGLAELSGQPMMVDEFARLGVGQWFRYFTGGVELCAAALLVTPSLASLGALLAVCTMLGAITAHLIKLGGSPAAAIVFLLLGLVIAGGRQRVVRSPQLRLLGSHAP